VGVLTGFPFLDEPRERCELVAMAHRGGAKHPDLPGLENTLDAFRHAVGLGYRYLETDVHATRDGHLLAFHDTHLDRVTDGTGRLTDLTLAEVKSLTIAGRAGIPLLVELLEELPQARFNVDLKSPPAVDALVDVLESTRAYDRLLVASFDERTLRRFRRRVSRPVPTAGGLALVLALKFAPYPLHASRLVRDTGSVLQIPVRNRGLTVLDRRMLELAHATGRHVHAWTVDDRSEMERLIDLGVDGIITDRTDTLREVLQERGLWETSR
jgi:glycerophosphoryl diester phosphodiesterase